MERILQVGERIYIMAQREYPNIRINDYLALDQNAQDVRYEYLEGELQMLAGGSPDHSIIAMNLAGFCTAC